MAKWEPKRFPVRKPTDLMQGVGRIFNPPRTLKLGGEGEAKVFRLDNVMPGVGVVPRGEGPVSDQGKGGANPI